MDTASFKPNSTGSVFYLDDGGAPEPDLSTSRRYSPGEQVILLLDATVLDERMSSVRAEVVEALGDSLRLRTAHECWPLPGLKLLDRGQELVVSRSDVFGVIARA